MFSEIFPLLLFFLLSVIAKSLNDKKEIKNRKRSISKIEKVQVKKQPQIKKDEQKTETISFDEAKIFNDLDEEDKKNRYYEKLFDEEDAYSGEDYKLKVEILDETNKNKKYKYNRNIKKDILTGIIFSEILSKPKSMENNRIR